MPATTCAQEKRTICAEDSCHVVEGEPEVREGVETAGDTHNYHSKCMEKTVENTIDTPEETCSMEPVEECKNVTIR